MHASKLISGGGCSVFSVGYMLFEIPSNLIFERVGARTWLSRIVITWGLLACGCALVASAASLITMRALLGVAEAGFRVPGCPAHREHHRSLVVGCDYGNGRDARDRRLALVVPAAGTAGRDLRRGRILLSHRPSGQRQLALRRREVDAGHPPRARCNGARPGSGAHPSSSIMRQILNWNVVLLGLTFSTMVSNFSALAIWLPQIVRGMMGPGAAYWQVGLIAAIPPLCTLCAIPFWSWRSDRCKERYWHCVGPLMIAVASWGLAAATSSPVLQLLGLTIASVGSISAWPVFLTIPSLVLAREAHPAGIAFVTTIGLAGAVYSPIIIGAMKDLTGHPVWVGTHLITMRPSTGGVHASNCHTVFSSDVNGPPNPFEPARYLRCVLHRHPIAGQLDAVRAGQPGCAIEEIKLIHRHLPARLARVTRFSLM